MSCFSRHRHHYEDLIADLRRELEQHIAPLGYEVVEVLYLGHSIVFRVRKVLVEKQ